MQQQIRIFVYVMDSVGNSFEQKKKVWHIQYVFVYNLYVHPYV